MNILFFLTPKEEVAFIEESDTLRQALEKMEHHGFAALPLLSKKGKYIGTVTEGDLLWYMKDHDFPKLQELEEVSIGVLRRHRDNKAVNVHETIEGLFDRMINQNFVPVVDDDKIFIGIVTRKDVLLHFSKEHMQGKKKD